MQVGGVTGPASPPEDPLVEEDPPQALKGMPKTVVPKTRTRMEVLSLFMGSPGARANRKRQTANVTEVPHVGAVALAFDWTCQLRLPALIVARLR